MTDELRSSIDDNLLVVSAEKKIPVDALEGAFYGSGNGASIPRTIITDRLSTSATVPSGTTLNSTLTFNTPPIVFAPQMMFSLYVGTDGDSTCLWPAGSTLTSANRPRVTWLMNEALSDPRSGAYVWSFSIKNESAGSQDFYLHVRLLIPAQTVQQGSAV